MNWEDIRVVFTHEMRGALREKNIVLYTFLVPALLYPLVVWLAVTAVSYLTGLHEKADLRVAIVNVPAIHQSLRQRLEIDPRIRLVKSDDVHKDLDAGKLDVALEFEPPDKCLILRDTSRTAGYLAADHLRQVLRSYRDLALERVALRDGVTVADTQPVFMEFKNLASSQDLGKYLLGTLLPFTLILVLSLAGLYPAIDATAGERERQTWETSLTLATHRINLVTGKYLYVSSMAVIAGVLNLIAMTFSLRSMLAPMIGEMEDPMVLTLPFFALVVVLIGTVLVALMMSAVLMLVASFARSFREGQALVSPVFLLMVLPVSMVMDKTVVLNAYTALIPIVNVALQWREAIAGRVNGPTLLEILAVQLIYTFVCLSAANFFMKDPDAVLIGFRVWRRKRG
jgi:sodium transport system permease protein